MWMFTEEKPQSKKRDDDVKIMHQLRSTLAEETIIMEKICSHSIRNSDFRAAVEQVRDLLNKTKARHLENFTAPLPLPPTLPQSVGGGGGGYPPLPV